MKRKAMYSLPFAAVVSVLVLISTALHASEADDRIAAAFRQSYAYRTYLKNDAIRADVSNGVVTLTGTVLDAAHKSLAQSVASNLSGAVRVDNQVVVEFEGTPVSADELLARNVDFVLRFHRNVIWGKPAVQVKDGVVTLHGEASGPADKELIGEYVAEVAGVREVRNEMTVASILEPVVQATNNETLDDASITAQVVTTLMMHRQTSSVIPRISTRTGVVTVTGIAKNQAQNALIVKLISNVRGVISVQNEMTIENVPGSP